MPRYPMVDLVVWDWAEDQIRERKMHIYKEDAHPPWLAGIVLLLCLSSSDFSCWSFPPRLWLLCHSFWQSSGCDLWRWEETENGQIPDHCWAHLRFHPPGHVDTHSSPKSRLVELCNTQETTCGILPVVSCYTAFTELLWGVMWVFNKPCWIFCAVPAFFLYIFKVTF